MILFCLQSSLLRGGLLFRWFALKRRFAVGILAFVLTVATHVALPNATVASPVPALQQAQTLNVLGEAALNDQQPKVALEYWEQAEAQYRKADDETGQWGSQLNQAKVLQQLGFYRRAQGKLAQLVEATSSQPDSLLKTNILLTKGRGHQLLGDLPASQADLEAGLAIAQTLNDLDYQQVAHLYLGNALAAQQQWTAAAERYITAKALPGPLTLTAELGHLQILAQLGREDEMQAKSQELADLLMAELAAQQVTLGTDSTQLYAALELSRWSLQSPDVDDAVVPTLLQVAVDVAEQKGDRTAESYGKGYLGQWYEQQQQWAVAQQETKAALAIANTLEADELIYQWAWQAGRIDRSVGETERAIADYAIAVDALQNLRQSLVAMSRDAQFSFRDQIEPIYRDLVGLLLTPELIAKRAPEENARALEQARQTIEDLQLVELNNFFREPCLESVSQSLDDLDPTAAVLYPIVLPDRLVTILSIPDQPLTSYDISLPQSEIEAGIQQMLDSMRATSFETERMAAAQQLYQWLIEPAEQTLQAHNIQTLAFVLDESLRSLPVAALYNGNHYLVDDYQIALSPGLQLLQVGDQALGGYAGKTDLSSYKALVGGLSQSVRGGLPLAGVKQEIDQIEQLVDTQVLLDKSFTKAALIDQTRRRSFDIVHFASHAQFGATEAQTFIETWDGELEISQLRQLLVQQEIRGLPPALLILSACDTAQGDRNAILGMAGMAVRSGAQSTLATLWQVNDQATATFVKYFYDGLIRDRLTRAQAVQYAQQQMRQTPAFQHPYYWAPFVLVGNWT